MSESQTYIERFRELRGDVLKTLDGVNASGLNWRPTRKETNSLFILATHLLGSERGWIHQVIGKREVQRDRAAEFLARGSSADVFRESFDSVARSSEEILSALSSADMDAERQGNYGLRSVRWCILHMLEHYSQHEGQMSLTRQMWEEQAKRKKLKGPSGKRKAKGVKRKVTSGKRKK